VGMSISFSGAIKERPSMAPKRPVRQHSTPFPDVFHRDVVSLDEVKSQRPCMLL